MKTVLGLPVLAGACVLVYVWVSVLVVFSYVCEWWLIVNEFNYFDHWNARLDGSLNGEIEQRSLKKRRKKLKKKLRKVPTSVLKRRRNSSATVLLPRVDNDDLRRVLSDTFFSLFLLLLRLLFFLFLSPPSYLFFSSLFPSSSSPSSSSSSSSSASYLAASGIALAIVTVSKKVRQQSLPRGFERHQYRNKNLQNFNKKKDQNLRWTIDYDTVHLLSFTPLEPTSLSNFNWIISKSINLNSCKSGWFQCAGRYSSIGKTFKSIRNTK